MSTGPPATPTVRLYMRLQTLAHTLQRRLTATYAAALTPCSAAAAKAAKEAEDAEEEEAATAAREEAAAAAAWDARLPGGAPAAPIPCRAETAYSRTSGAHAQKRGTPRSPRSPRWESSIRRSPHGHISK